MAKIVDPDALVRNTEIIFDTTNKYVQLVATGNLSDTSPATDSGVTLQAVYSKCKELWKSETDLNKLRFPFDAITPAKMDLTNGWDWQDATTRRLIRDGGWSLVKGGVSVEQYMSIISLGGAFAASGDQAYYQQTSGFNQVASSFYYTGALNEPVKTFASNVIDYRGFYKIFLREQAKSYAKGNLITDQGLATLDYSVYKLPLVNATDIKVTVSDSLVDLTKPYVGSSDLVITDGEVLSGEAIFKSVASTFTSADIGKLITINSGEAHAGRYEITVWNSSISVTLDRSLLSGDTTIAADRRPKGMTVDYYKGTLFETWTSGDSYISGNVTLDDVVSPNRWFRSKTEHTGQNVNPSTDGTNWQAYPGEREIASGSYYAFNRVVDGNAGNAEQIYQFLQRQLRQTGASGKRNINDSIFSGEVYGTMYGDIAVAVANFLGDTLQSNPGTMIDDIDPSDKVRLELFDITVDGGGLDAEGIPIVSTKRAYPFVAAGTIAFNDLLVDDADAEFCMYFTANPAGNFDTVNAVIVQDADGNNIKAESINGDVNFTFDYDNNVQGGRTAATDAAVTIVALGLNGAQWVVGSFTITRAVGLSFPVNAAQERNYANP